MLFGYSYFLRETIAQERLLLYVCCTSSVARTIVGIVFNQVQHYLPWRQGRHNVASLAIVNTNNRREEEEPQNRLTVDKQNRTERATLNSKATEEVNVQRYTDNIRHIFTIRGAWKNLRPRKGDVEGNKNVTLLKAA